MITLLGTDDIHHFLSLQHAISLSQFKIMTLDNRLYDKYNQSVPRYTSYPALPNWHQTPTEGEWKTLVQNTFRKSNSEKGISLYIHLPFCESLCTYCACNKRITKNHKVEIPYLRSLLKEWEIYKGLFEEKPIIKELHLGGGTPTFFKARNLEYFLSQLLEDAVIPENKAFSFEGHPSNTTLDHLQVLAKFGFNRMSLGIQDMDLEVQRAINRFQTTEEITEVVNSARGLGFSSINFDIIYGLPFQKLCSLPKTVDLVNLLRPERIAFYGYAHVPWKSKVQRKYSDHDVPKGSSKRLLYEFGTAQFRELGYKDFGLDHFALPSDELFKAYKNKTLHRNFMGYTIQDTDLLIGLGCSAISDCGNAMIQNEKLVEQYQSIINQGEIPLIKGHVLSDMDLKVKDAILELLCQHELPFRHELPLRSLSDMKAFLQDELISFTKDKLIVTKKGEPFIRTICAALDPYMRNKVDGMFSRAV
ncbi:MAG: oxygen-independent coproporphyrinogen III oxidase [Flavobacteriales bacterium]|nr:oxygen-independent coproporphyrinogen III oxidase [Flavobacteriales bacterium]